MDSIPRIGWFRLSFPAEVDVIPVWQGLENDARLWRCGLNLAYPVFDEETGNATPVPQPQPSRDEIQWPSYITGAVDAWGQVPPSSDVLITILDTGCDTDHIEFQGCSRVEYGRDWSKVAIMPPEAYNGHGMWRLGEIAAPLDGQGVAGINQNCRVRVEKVTDDSPLRPYWSLWWISSALECAVFVDGARVVNCSFTGAAPGNGGFGVMEDAFFDVNESAPGTVILCGTGNSGEGSGEKDKMYYPAAWSCDLECVLAVGASTETDEYWLGSEWRPGTYECQVSLLAPGDPLSYETTDLNDGYCLSWGMTSGATAHASGIAAMLISKFQWLENAQIKDILQNSAYRIAEPEGCSWGDYSDCWGHQCWCDRPGSGRIDAVYCLRPRIWVRCPRGAQTLRPPCNGDIGMSGGALSVGEICVYDLLGRRLVSLPLPKAPWNKASILSYVGTQGGLPRGAKIVRLRTEREVLSWRMAP